MTFYFDRTLTDDKFNVQFSLSLWPRDVARLNTCVHYRVNGVVGDSALVVFVASHLPVAIHAPVCSIAE